MDSRIVGAVLLIIAIHGKYVEAEACNGYTLKLNYVKSCNKDSLIKIPKGFDATFDKECRVRFNGCLDITKTIKTSKASYLMKKPPLPPIKGNMDFCELAETAAFPQLGDALSIFSIPTKCPIPKKKYCANTKKGISIAQYKNTIGMVLGNTTVKLELDTDSGKSCTEFSFTIQKPK